MNGPVRRSASWLLSAADALLPRELSSWSLAMRGELVEIDEDWAALLFAAGCLRAALALAAAARLRPLFEGLRLHPTATPTGSPPDMDNIWARPRLLGLGCGAAAVALGAAYMIAAGAPWRYVFVNLAALILGAAVWLLLGRSSERVAAAAPVVLPLGLGLMATALFGDAVEGASRWVNVGPLSLQISLIVLPAMMVLYARRPEPIGTIGMAVAALAVALQPDRAMAGVLSAGLFAVALTTRSRLAAAATAAAAAAFGWTLLAPDALPAVPYVDRILYTAFAVHVLAGAAVLLGAAALMLPALSGLGGRDGERPVLLTFGLCWSAIVAAAALGNYPTPLVGYGGSAVLGYLLSVALLPNRAGEAARRQAAAAPVDSGESSRRDGSERRVAGMLRPGWATVQALRAVRARL